MKVHPNSKLAFKRYSYTDAPNNQQNQILKAMINARRPLTFYEIADLTGLPVYYMGELIGKGLIQMKLVFELKNKRGVSPRGNYVKLVVCKHYLKSHPDCPELVNDPRGRKKPINPQLNLF